MNPDPELTHAPTGISRRELMRLLGVAGGGAALAASFGSARAGGLSEPGEAIQLLQVTEGERPEIVIGVSGIPPVLDPGQGGSSSIVGSRVSPIFHESLLDCDFRDSDPIGFGTTIIPALAASWSRIDDLTLEVTLRDGLLFHDGTPVTAEDVQFTIERIISPDADPALAVVRVAYAGYDHVEVVDPHTVRIVTTNPDAALEERLTNLYIVPKAYVQAVGNQEFAMKPIGAGPYRVVEFAQGDRIVLEAFDDYYGGLPPFSKVTVQAIPEVATRVAALLSDDVQIITTLPPDQYDLLAGNDGVAAHTIATANAHFYFFNTRHPVLASTELRHGLNLAVDRQLLIDTLWLGRAEMMRGYQIPQWGDMYNPDRPVEAYDPERAKELIAASGYDGAEIVYRAHPTYYTLGAEAALAVVAMWQDVGVNARVELSEDPHGDKETLMVAGWSAGLNPNDPTVGFMNIWSPAGMPQTYFWTPSSPEFNEGFEVLTQSLDTAARYGAYQRMLDIMAEDAPASFLYQVHEVYGVRSDIGWTPYTVFKMDLRQRNITPGA